MAAGLGSAPVNTVPRDTIRVSYGGTHVFDGTLRVADADDDILTVELYVSSGFVTLGSEAAFSFSRAAPASSTRPWTAFSTTTRTGSPARRTAASRP